MEYVEYLRVRRGLVSYAVALAFCFVVVTLMVHGNGGLHIKMSFDRKGVPVGDLLQLGGIGAFFLATMFAGNLPGESATLSFLWTKPIARTTLAARFVAIDTLGLITGIVLVGLVSAIVMAGMGQLHDIRVARSDAAGGALALGAPLAWYGITLLASARLGRDGAARAGALVWPVFLFVILLGTMNLPPPGHALVVALEHVDPLAYLLGSDQPGSGLLGATLQRAAACWAIALVTITAAIRLWSTREA